MATAVHMDYTLPLNRVPHFKCFYKHGTVRMWAICAIYAIEYTSNLQKHGASLKYSP